MANSFPEMLEIAGGGFKTYKISSGFECQRPRNFAAPRASAGGAAFWRPAPRAPLRPCQPCQPRARAAARCRCGGRQHRTVLRHLLQAVRQLLQLQPLVVCRRRTGMPAPPRVTPRTVWRLSSSSPWCSPSCPASDKIAVTGM